VSTDPTRDLLAAEERSLRVSVIADIIDAQL
jgi:hypothetical protein